MFGKFVFISFIFKEDCPTPVQHLYNDHEIRMIDSEHLYKHEIFWETKKKVAFGQGKPRDIINYSNTYSFVSSSLNIIIEVKFRSTARIRQSIG